MSVQGGGLSRSGFSSPAGFLEEVLTLMRSRFRRSGGDEGDLSGIKIQKEPPQLAKIWGIAGGLLMDAEIDADRWN